ncbi:hypothetical protein [Streptomyces sp. ICBB 8177]|uniref:hypothetical protein n=1 Tax=Streptomyces sp. ICBB 8177 TaxID=563922 RepID=UPI000D67A2DF|nr:hypothetical protein [Streptomyces sp. ICBB 8177]PWI41862.1 hypothetical protein CK485_24005 [Streptomyces sp. ICBB 8177]
MIHRNRRTLRLAVVAASGLCALGLAAGTASAKSGIYFSAGPHNVRLGSLIHATGHGEDDNATFNKFCVQERSGGSAWKTLRCSRGSYNGGGSVSISTRAERRGVVSLRGVLLEGSSPKDNHPKVRLTSRVFALAVR